MILTGWGRFPRHDCRVTEPQNEADVKARISEGHVIARGNGRAYGDSAVSRENTLDMRYFNRVLAFDEAGGQVVVEAGLLLSDLIAQYLPRGWFPSVTPGTKFVTIGGMIAADVHGKNHHKAGSFGHFVDWIEIMGRDGEVRRCSRGEHADLFDWTVGGMGLTGVILRAAFRMQPVETGWIDQTMIPVANLGAAMDAFEDSLDATYSVAWIDCLASGPSLGRSLVMLGEHAERADLPAARRKAPFDVPAKRNLSVPFNAPVFALNRFTVRMFNALYFRNGARKAGASLVDWDSYFYPLDAILSWNRIYGRKGFAQFQCVLPLASSAEGLETLLSRISRAGQGSFLAVLKRFGAQDSRFSFPMEGYTLALDFPVTKKSLALMAELDRIVIDHGGRIYLAKDSRMSAETLRRSDPRAEAFVDMREASAARPAFMSQQAERLEL
jgi:FAD/FMN-containing dehydrogenase